MTGGADVTTSGFAVNITWPPNGTILPAPATLSLGAVAEDPVGDVAKVEFYAESQKVGEATTPPYRVEWSDVTAGFYWLTAIATDDQGAISVSAPVEIAVTSGTCGSTAGAAPTKGPSPDANTSPLQVYFGQDLSAYAPFGQNQVPRPSDIPVSRRAAGAFRSRLPGVLAENFEEFAWGTVPTQVQFGTNVVSLSGDQIVNEVTDPNGTINGEFPISGTHGLELMGNGGSGYFELDFATPQAAFGFYATDIELNGLKVTLFWPDGTSKELQVPVKTPQGSGGAIFFGVIDATDPFIKAELSRDGSLEDSFLFDDLLVATAAELIPEFDWPKVRIEDGLPAIVPPGQTDQVEFSVALSRPLTNAVDVSYTTIDGTAEGGVDYTSTNGVVHFAPGETSAKILVDVLALSSGSVNRYFSAQLQNPTNALLGQCEATGLITRLSNTPVPVPNRPPTVRLTQPADRTIFNVGQSIEILPEATDPDGSVTSVDFYVGDTRIGSAATPPYTFTWTNAVEGDYVLTARATDGQGLVASSSPVRVGISEVCGAAAIIASSPGPEIVALVDDLYELGVRSTVFDRSNVITTNLESFDLIIWDDLGREGVGAADVAQLQDLWNAGKAVYVIGDDLVSALPSLSADARAQWIRQLGMEPSGNALASSPIQLLRESVGSLGAGTVIQDGKVGSVEDFSYPFGTNAVAQAVENDGVTVLGRAGNADVLVAIEESSAGGSGRRIAQLFEVVNGTDEQSLAQRKRLFQNAVWWLLNCRLCSNLNLHPEGTSSPDTIVAGGVLTYNLTIDVAGGCEALGVTLTSVLPTGAEFISAQSQRGQWSYADGVVTYQLGRLTRDSGLPETVTLAVRPTLSGSLTNHCSLGSLNETAGALADNTFEVVTQVQPGLRLRISRAARNQVLVSVEGPFGRSCTIETTDHGGPWSALRDLTLATGTNSFLETFPGPTKERMYRAALK